MCVCLMVRLKLLIGEIDAELLEGVRLEDLEAEDIDDAENPTVWVERTTSL